MSSVIPGNIAGNYFPKFLPEPSYFSEYLRVIQKETLSRKFSVLRQDGLMALSILGVLGICVLAKKPFIENFVWESALS
jgi:hypothetical protein